MDAKRANSGKVSGYLSALAITLGLHVLVLLFLWLQPVRGANAQLTQYVEVGMVELPHAEVSPTTSLQTMLEKRIENEVANLIADVSKSTSSEQISSRSNSDEQQMEAEIESELRAVEKAEFERLAAEKKDFGLDGVPDDGAKDVENNFAEWDRRYDGQVTVAFAIPGRDALHLDVPGFRCLGGGEVILQVEVTGDGQVRKAILERVSVSEMNELTLSLQDCLVEQAIKSAKQSTFRATPQGVATGSLTYLFVAQQ